MKLFSTKHIVISMLSSACAGALSATQIASQTIIHHAIRRTATPRPLVPLFPTNTSCTSNKQEQDKENKKRHEYIALPDGYKVINYVLSENRRCMFIIAKHEKSAQTHLYAVLVYDRKQQKCISSAIHQSEITSLAIHPAGTYFATISKTVSKDGASKAKSTGNCTQQTDTTVAVWETLTGKPRKTWYHLKDVSWVRFMHDADGITVGTNPKPQESHPNTPHA